MKGEEMKTKPILFSGEMVRALLDGRKTQTRRILRPQPLKVDVVGDGYNFWYKMSGWGQSLMDTPRPYGQPGDLLWVREGFRSKRVDKLPSDVIYRADHPDASHVPGMYGRPWKPSIHMPRWASRLTLKITDVRVERVQDISEADAGREGCPHGGRGALNTYGVEVLQTKREWFIGLWDAINAARGYGWDTNPWVWVIEFEVIHKNVAEVEAQGVK